MKILIRHAESDFNSGKTKDFNSSVNDNGISQAKEAGKSLEKLINENTIIYTSPYSRCLQTVKNMNLNLKTKVNWHLGELPIEIHRNNAIVYAEKEKFPEFEWNGLNHLDYSQISEKIHLSNLNDFVKYLHGNCIVVSHRPVINYLIWLMTGLDKPVKNCEINII